MTGYIPRWHTGTQTVTHSTTDPAAHSRESNSRPVDHKSGALTTTVTTPPSRFKSDQDEIIDRIVLQANAHRLTESNF